MMNIKKIFVCSVLLLTILMAPLVFAKDSPCLYLKLKQQMAYRLYQASLTTAEAYAGNEFSECQDLWLDYNNACENYTDAYLKYWLQCVKPQISPAITRKTEQLRVEGNMDQILNDCALDVAQALAENC